MSNAILPQATVLLGAGMIIVYIFLYVMVVVMRGVALIVPRFNHLMPDEEAKKPRTVPVPVSAPNDAAIAIAVAAAVDRSRP